MQHGLEYSRALTPFPSDSFPGMVGQVTGGDPGVTGIYYDDTWNHAIFPAGTTNCSGPAPGGEVTYFEAADLNPDSLDAGQGLTGLPGSILLQTVSTAEKLPTSDGLIGGYLPGGTVPGPLLTRALDYIIAKVGAMVAEIRAQGLARSTAIIISAKHGQSPTDPKDLARVPDGPIIDGINAALCG